MRTQALRRFKKQSNPEYAAERSVPYNNSSPSSSASDLPRLHSLSNSQAESPSQSDFHFPDTRRSSTESEDLPTMDLHDHDTSPTLVAASSFHSHRVNKRPAGAGGASTSTGSPAGALIANPHRRRAVDDNLLTQPGFRSLAGAGASHTTFSSLSSSSTEKQPRVVPRAGDTTRSVVSGGSLPNGHVAIPHATKKPKKAVRLESLTYVPTKEFDNDQGDLKFAENDLLVDVDNKRKYRVMSKIGSGTFGQVVKVELAESGDDESELELKKEDMSPSSRVRPKGPKQYFAVKIIKNKEAYHAQALKETNILQRLNSRWDPDDRYNIVRLLSVFYDKGHLMLMFPVLGWNLYELLRAHQHRGFKTSVVQVFIQQVTSALICLAHAGIVHTDLKPENVLLESSDRWKIKVIDFGSASYENHNASTYIQSRFYRAPEVILGVGYNRAIDMWSLGCIAAELFLGLPLFPGKNEFNQLCRITKVLKAVPQHILAQGSRTHLFYNQVGEDFIVKDVNVWAKENNTQPVPMTEYFPGGSLEEIIMARNLSPSNDARVLRHEHQERILLVDFIRKCLEFDFGRRMTPFSALKHQFIARVPSAYVSQRASAVGVAVATGATGQQATVPGATRVGMTATAAQAYKFYPQQMAFAAMQRQQQEMARYQLASQQAAMTRQANMFGVNAGAMPQQPDMNAIIAARKQNPPQRWRHKSYDVGQHMRAEEHAKRRRRLAAQTQANGAPSNQMAAASAATTGPRKSLAAMSRPVHATAPHVFSRSAHSTPTSPQYRTMRPRHASASSGVAAEVEQPRRATEPVAAAGDIPAEFIQRVQASRSRKRAQRRKRLNRPLKAKSLDEMGPVVPVSDWGSRSMTDIASLAQTNETRSGAFIGYVPRQSSDPQISSTMSRGRSNTCPDMVAAVLPPVAVLTTTATHAQIHSSLDTGVPAPIAIPQPPQPRRLYRHYSQPIGNGPNSQGGGPTAADSAFIAQHRQQQRQARRHRRAASGSVSAQSSPVGVPLSQYVPQYPQTAATDLSADYYGQYMHEYISARGQEHINELGQRTRHLRTWQTPQTRYF